jgi:hypothetical protein
MTGVAGLALNGGVSSQRRLHGMTSTTSSPPRSSPPTAAGCTRAPTSTRTSTGHCAAAVATSAS